jgi:hypothetical protein
MTAGRVLLALVLSSSAAGIAFLAASGCTTDTTSTVDPGPTGEPTIELVSPMNGACVEVPNGPSPFVQLVAHVSQLQLSPPGTCTVAQCGHLRLSANGILVGGATSTTAGPPDGGYAVANLDLDLTRLPTVYGDIVAKIELIDDANDVDDAGSPVVPHDGGFERLSSSVTFTTRPSCADAGR